MMIVEQYFYYPKTEIKWLLVAKEEECRVSDNEHEVSVLG